MNKILNDPNGKAICVLLYSIGAFCAAKKKPMPLLLLMGTHALEFLVIGWKVAKDHDIPVSEALPNCLAFPLTIVRGFHYLAPRSRFTVTLL